MTSVVTEVGPGVFKVHDTCNVYVIRADPAGMAGAERTAIAIDFGSGLALDHLDEMGIDRVTDVLLTHHHRDQAQGLPRAAAAGIRIHVPPVEQDLFAHVDEMWRTRPVVNDYNLRQDRFSLLEPIEIAGTVPEYRSADYHGVTVEVHATPGHTTGSVTYVVERDGQRLAFTGDLIYAPGKVWSLAATQWTYTDNAGPAMAVLSAYLLLREHLTVLFPSHGQPMHDPAAALGLLADRMQRYVDQRRPAPWDLRARLDDPFVSLTEHFLMNRSSMATSYVLLSSSGAALVIDYGYDMTTGLPPGADRAARRPWLASMPALKANYGVSQIEVALPTHYHDDHVAGLNLLRDVEGTQIWAPSNVAPTLANPGGEDLPCQWFDPIRADRVLPLGETFAWREYELTVHELPGHTLYAAAFEFEVDGVRVLVTGDQQEGLGVPGSRRDILNYQYRNRFRIEDYRASAALYRRIAPGVMVSGHWEPRWVDEVFLDMLAEEAEELVAIHHDLLPLAELDMGSDGVVARIAPYRSRAAAGSVARFHAIVRNPHQGPATARIVPAGPKGWRAMPTEISVLIEAGQELDVPFELVIDTASRGRQWFAIDVTIGDVHFGQHAEALVEVFDDAVPRTARQGSSR